MLEKTNQTVTGHVLIRDAETKEVIIDKYNAIHFENMATTIAMGLANRSVGNIHEMVFGSGATVNGKAGEITYFPPNTKGEKSQLYTQRYRKVVDDQSPLNFDKDRCHIRVNHIQNSSYADLVITCVLDHSEPDGQEAFDDSSVANGNFVFDEIGLKAYDATVGSGRLISHVIFHPVQKSLNRTIEIIYTIRIQMF